MSTGPVETPRLSWNKHTSGGEAELRINERYQSSAGMRKLLLVETALALAEQQAPTWHLHSAVVSLGAEPEFGVAGIRITRRPVVSDSALVNVHIVQGEAPIVGCVAAFERTWHYPSDHVGAPWLGEPHLLPRLRQTSILHDEVDCRDASKVIAVSHDPETRGGFARHVLPRALAPHDLVTLFEPWLPTADARGRRCSLEEVVLEMHRSLPTADIDPARYSRVVTRRAPDAHRDTLIANLWSYEGRPLATAFVRMPSV